MRIGNVDNHSSERDEYPVTASHHTVQVELAERVEFDQTSVLERLKIWELDSAFVESCMESVLSECAASVKKLKKLSAMADNVPLDDLGFEAVLRPDPTVAKGTLREKMMYPPLGVIFEHIRSYTVPGVAPPTLEYNRCFVNQTSNLVPDQYHTLGFPRFIPDFTLFYDYDMLQRYKQEKKRWRYQDAFVEVKAGSKQHPFPNNNNDATPLLTQVANYARLHLSVRPFSAFSVGLMIYGSKFCIGMFDRMGGQLSPEYDLWENLDIFIRVVRNMTRVLTDKELGRDPSATALDLGDDSELAFKVDPVGSDPRTWLTVGKPLWSSLSLFGRGTTVWHVQKADKLHRPVGAVFVMKSSWRSSKRHAESEIYRSIRNLDGLKSDPGIAKFLDGADVKFPSGKDSVWGELSGSPITAHKLRNLVPSPLEEETMYLHRIILASNGIPIWEYKSDEQLLKGLRDALSGHKHLWDQGILHRDVSAGNILLSADIDKQKSWGFLTDVEYARMSSVHTVETRAEEPVRAPTAYGPIHPRLAGKMTRIKTIHTPFMRGAAISGTFQFMSRRLLLLISQGETSIQTEVGDDVESFYWVLLYAVFRKLVTNMDSVAKSRAEGKLIRTSFLKMFGGTSAKEILDGRASALQAIEADDLFMTDVAADRISHALRVLLWHYNTTHLRNTAVKSHRPRAKGIKDHKPRPSTKALAKVFNHKDLMSDLDVAAAGGLLGTDESDMSVDD